MSNELVWGTDCWAGQGETGLISGCRQLQLLPINILYIILILVSRQIPFGVCATMDVQ